MGSFRIFGCLTCSRVFKKCDYRSNSIKFLEFYSPRFLANLQLRFKVSYSGIFKKRSYSLGFSCISKKHGYRLAIAAFFVNAVKKNATIARIFCSGIRGMDIYSYSVVSLYVLEAHIYFIGMSRVKIQEYMFI